MANLTQSSQTTATQAPTYYTDYLANLAGAGTAAQKAAQFVGAQPLQQQAFQNVGTAATAYQPTLEQAGSTLGQAAGAVTPLQAGADYLSQAAGSPADKAAQYMSPYLSSVVNAIGDVGQRNIQQNLSPLAIAGAAGSGQFGSQRANQVLGQTISNADRDILNQQYQALNTGYGQALQAGTAQNQLLGQLGSTAGTQAGQGQQNLTQAGTALGNLAAQNQNLSLADINALATLGGQQQTIAQNQQTFPLTTLSTLASLMAGQQIPTTTSTQLNTSPLSTLASLGASGAGINQLGGGAAGLLSQGITGLSDLLKGTGGQTVGPGYAAANGLPTSVYSQDGTSAQFISADANGNAIYADKNGNRYDQNGYPISATQAPLQNPAPAPTPTPEPTQNTTTTDNNLINPLDPNSNNPT
jgi:hypothetical protein